MRWLRHHALSLFALGLFVALWEVISRLGWISPVLLSSPSRIATIAPAFLAQPTLRADLLHTLVAFGLALALATLIGSLLGVLLGISRRAYQLLNPFIVATNSLPKVVLMPLIVLWVGIGMTASLLLGTLMASFPLLISTHGGVRNLDAELLQVARAYGARRGFIARTILLPGLLPYVLSGLRVGVNYALVGVLLSEFFAATRGVGYRMMLLMSNFEVDRFFVLLLLVAAFSIGCTALIHALERRLERFRPQAFDEAGGGL